MGGGGRAEASSGTVGESLVKENQMRNVLFFLQGKVLSGILISNGVHCRLENISDDGRWVSDEKFTVGSETVERKAGEKVHPSVMKEWRELRQREPGLFTNLRVWQQPAAVVDGIIWRWQCELEAAEYRQSLRTTDTLSAAWSKQGKHATWLLQQLGCPVPEGCTPLCQPTDTHLAKPAKDAGRVMKENLREVMRAAGAQLGQPVSYESGKKEMVQVAVAMQTAMEELNNRTEVVLQSARAGGWLAYRPDGDGKLLHADRQDWAKAHLETAGRVSAEQLGPRYDWLGEGGKPVRTDQTDHSKEQHLPPVEPDDGDLVLEDWEPDHLTEEEKALATKAQTHPSQRTQDDLQAQIAGLTQYQKALEAKSSAEKETAMRSKDKAGKKHRAKVLRKSLAAQFEAELASAGGSVQKRLAELHPTVVGKKGKAARKNTKKGLKKKEAGLKKAQSAGRKARKWLKKKGKRSAQWESLTEEAASQLGQDNGPLKGKSVRLVGTGLTDLLRNSPAKVTKHYKTQSLVTVTLISGSAISYPVKAVYELTGKEKLPLAEKDLDMRKVPLQSKRAALRRSGGQLRTQLTGQTLLETPEVGAAWSELGARAKLAGDVWPNPLAVCPSPQELAFALQCWQDSPGSPDSQTAKVELQKEMQPAFDRPDEAAFASWQIVSHGHWTWLNFTRQAKAPDQAAPNKWVAVYRDSLNQPSAACRERAVLAYSLAVEAFGADRLALQALPPVERDSVQTDVSSCGFHVLQWTEQEYRWLRGEGQFRLTAKFTNKAADLNRFFKTVILQQEKESKQQAKPAASAEQAVGASQPKAPSPVPPPADPLPLAAPPVSLSGTFGCSRCRWAKSGCQSCNPEKALKAVEKTQAKPAPTKLSALDSLALPPAKRRRQ